MSRYFLTLEAKQDIKEISQRIALENPAAAKRLVAEIKQKCKRAADFPEMGHSYDSLLPSLRGLFVGSYIIFYFPRKNSIQVIRVLSGYRNLDTIFQED